MAVTNTPGQIMLRILSELKYDFKAFRGVNKLKSRKQPTTSHWVLLGSKAKVVPTYGSKTIGFLSRYPPHWNMFDSCASVSWFSSPGVSVPGVPGQPDPGHTTPELGCPRIVRDSLHSVDPR
ncbi:hypothetical protein M422DRAFT_253707 [Sphaerobolus stellatus SS14]|uniref:Uncharacterized protein n=1 Tax=Sphaerobolus stellatus (strain SS14) TaxID=990650 RepID=A0A0C9VW56_SPHS4|nr:hypothetical protein M422DRAFT_253707 [Sphaerobolus stellatus SS14]